MRAHVHARTAALWLTASVIAAVSANAAFAAGSVDGEAAFNNACRTCHVMRDGENRLGPHLAGIVGRKAGAAEGFSYSAALKDSGLTWDEGTLDRFITNPESVVPGNTMKPYTGIADAATRAAITAFLKGNSAR